MKKCKNCGSVDTIKGRKLCKYCDYDRVKAYRRTKEGLITKIYASQKQNSSTRGHRKPDYTKEELKEWLFSQTKFHVMHKEWVLSGHKKKLTPSIDRVNDNVHYCFGNIQLMTHHENQSQSRTGNMKSVIQFSKDGKYINEYESMKSAGEVNNLCSHQISDAVNGRQPTCGGYVWRFKDV